MTEKQTSQTFSLLECMTIGLLVVYDLHDHNNITIIIIVKLEMIMVIKMIIVIKQMRSKLNLQPEHSTAVPLIPESGSSIEGFLIVMMMMKMGIFIN